MKYIGLADCNSFYASCERVFRPDLYGKPIVVLSNNDGCIVALSKEAKEIGIQRGVPLFKVKQELERKHVAVFSSNYTLYQDMSDRVMQLLQILTGDIEIYSIDECFFHPSSENVKNADKYISNLARFIKQGTGIPVSVGLARTKTLAKIANHVAKRGNLSFFLKKEDEMSILKETPIDEVWGIGWKTAPKLKSIGIKSAFDFINLDDDFILKNFTVTGYNTAMELRGHQIIGREKPAHLSVSSSISFSKPESDFDEICCAMVCHCTTVCDKLLTGGYKASQMAVQLITNRFSPDYTNSCGYEIFEDPTSYVPDFVTAGRKIVSRIFRSNMGYRSVRVIAWDLTPSGEMQLKLFDTQEKTGNIAKKDSISWVVSEQSSLTCASGYYRKKSDLAKCGLRSPLYTTRWSDIPLAGKND